jgi:hypothetical protein
METEKIPYTWAKLKEFCNSLNDEQLSQQVKVIQEDASLNILDASEIGDDHYKFDDEDYSVTENDYDADYHLDGKYESLADAIKHEDYILTPKTAVFLFEDF